jgi:hypothetical protein
MTSAKRAQSHPMPFRSAIEPRPNATPNALTTKNPATTFGSRCPLMVTFGHIVPSA